MACVMQPTRMNDEARVSQFIQETFILTVMTCMVGRLVQGIGACRNATACPLGLDRQHYRTVRNWECEICA
jgi:hypothetical protein